MIPISRATKPTAKYTGRFPSPPPVLGAIGVPGTSVAVGCGPGFLVGPGVGGTGVLVGGMGVAVGGIGVLVTGVPVGGGSGVLVGEPPTQWLSCKDG
jgi:hypothetical protein